MKSRRIIFSILIAVLTSWLALTCVIDFLVIPEVFAKVENFFKAGLLGASLFQKLNCVEVFFAIILLVLTGLDIKKSSRRRIHFLFSLILSSIAFFYAFFLTNKITSLTKTWIYLDSINKHGNKYIPDIQQAHQFYHELYIGIDSIKIVLLLITLFLIVYHDLKND